MNKLIEIKRWDNGEVIYAGKHGSIEEAVEHCARNKISLSCANLTGAFLADTDLSNARLSMADLTDADLAYANLSHANLGHADLSHADLGHTNLGHADLTYARLSKADLGHANLAYASLIGADLANASLSKTNITTFQFNRHFAFHHEGYVKIGCQGMALDEWLDSYEEIGKKEGYTEKEIKAYCLWLKMLKELGGE